MILERRTVLVISVFVCLFVGCDGFDTALVPVFCTERKESKQVSVLVILHAQNSSSQWRSARAFCADRIVQPGSVSARAERRNMHCVGWRVRPAGGMHTRTDSEKQDWNT